LQGVALLPNVHLLLGLGELKREPKLSCGCHPRPGSEGLQFPAGLDPRGVEAHGRVVGTLLLQQTLARLAGPIPDQISGELRSCGICLKAQHGSHTEGGRIMVGILLDSGPDG
jgi:hypothetical protein